MKPRTRQRSEARERLLATASQLFYAEGITAVGVDRIASEGHVTPATFYRHFPSKDDLVVAYLQSVHDAVAAQVAVRISHAHGADGVRALGDQVVSELGHEGFRGCAFMNASSEIEDPGSPVRRVIASNRRWYGDVVRRAFDEADHAHHPIVAALHFVMLRDGGMTGGALDDVTEARRTFQRGVERLLRPGGATPAEPAHGDFGLTVRPARIT